MTKDQDLTQDQKARIAATLARIRGGLKTLTGSPFDEPAHTFVAEAYYVETT
ncbi:hypothetical protein L0664_13005 [Octadecabacter sp. G9-8]|uniref:Uncharacterized protein n=1 Tax=Octadecabacter dasysiphoniae TaxID=2909341 RepID=A0ABS9CYW2_9RHOB|nr:hypothetical protein [Octadecabacter dasysiphoniae]MCF2871989.1 hypothetical protein [Octadecabacter dasysiphoniae]